MIVYSMDSFYVVIMDYEINCNPVNGRRPLNFKTITIVSYEIYWNNWPILKEFGDTLPLLFNSTTLLHFSPKCNIFVIYFPQYNRLKETKTRKIGNIRTREGTENENNSSRQL